MNLLITGAAGFIGSHLVHYLLHKYPNYRLVGLDNLSIGSNLKNIEIPDPEKKYRFDFVKGDICDESLISSLLSGDSRYGKFDGVIHLAAESHVDRSIEAPLGFVKTNVMGTANLLHQSYLNDLGMFLYVSTDEVYGSANYRAQKPMSETSPLLPNSPYSASKASGDNLCRAYFKTYGLPVVATRCTNNYGPNQFSEKLIPATVFRLLDGSPCKVYGTGQNTRDWLSVRDHVSALDMVFHRGTSGDCYNVAANNEIRNIDLVKKICLYLDKDPCYLIEYVPDRLGHDERYFINSDKIKALGWSPNEDFEKSLKLTVEWYRWAHATGYFQ